MTRPRLHAIFHRQVKGDQALLALAQRRFGEAGLGAEFYPGSPEELTDELRYLPRSSDRYTVHLPRHLKVLNGRDSHDRILAFAASTGERAVGLVLHDQLEVQEQLADYVAAARSLDARLREQGPGPLVFIEYAAGLPPERFVELHRSLADCPRLAACIDISHIGIRHCQVAFRRQQPTIEVCDLKPDNPGLRQHVETVQEVCRSALPVVLEVVEGVGRLGKHVHFHLHDGHPSSMFSLFGVSDHLSFYQEIPIPFSHQGRHHLPGMFGPLGLRSIIEKVRSVVPDERLSFTLEVHATTDRQPLGQYEDLFWHWRDRTNAERMQHWIEVLLRNHRLLRECCGER